MAKTIKQQISKSFSRYAGDYDSLASIQKQYNEILVKQVDKELKPQQSLIETGTLIDAGCGTGYLLSRLRELRPELQLQGFDLAAGMVARARKRGLNCRVGDLEAWPYPDKSADMLVSCFALHWVKHPYKVFQETWRVLKPQGKFIYILPIQGTFCELEQIFQEVLGSYPQKHWFFSGPAIVKAAEQSGLTVSSEKLGKGTTLGTDLRSLLKEIKNIGATGGHATGNLTKTKLDKLSATMLKNYGRFQLSYQVLQIQGVKITKGR
jgi:malonyl-CoA O-methyltransferase